MSLNAKTQTSAKKFNRETLEAGNYPGRLVQVIDLGLQEQRPYKGESKPPINEVILTYELSDEFLKGQDGEDDPKKPRFLSETLPFHNLVAEKAKSTQRYHAMDPEGIAEGDFTRLIGTPVGLNIVVDTWVDKATKQTRTKEKISSISTMRKKDAEKLPDLVNDPKVFNLDAPDLEVFETLPDWIKEKIKSNLEYNGSKLQALLAGAPAKTPKQEPKTEAETEGSEDDKPPY